MVRFILRLHANLLFANDDQVDSFVILYLFINYRKCYGMRLFANNFIIYYMYIFSYLLDPANLLSGMQIKSQIQC